MPIYLTDFEPVAQIDQFIKLIPDNAFYKVTWIEPIPAVIKDFGPMSALSSLTDQEVEEIYLDDGRLGQYRAIPIDDVYITVSQPRAAKKYALRNYTSSLTQLAVPMYPDLNILEFFQMEDREIYFTVVNPLYANQPSSRVMFAGYQFELEEVSRVPEKYTVVPVQAIGTKVPAVSRRR